MSNHEPATPAAFVAALNSIRVAKVRAEVEITEIPAPHRVAPYAVAVGGKVVNPFSTEEEVSSGRFIVFYDPNGQTTWQGKFRVVTITRANLDGPMGADPLLSQVAWSWLTEALSDAAAQHHASAGTVTRVLSESFGELGEREDEVEVEIRASWTPDDTDLGLHLQAWSQLLCAAGGLEPQPAGVSILKQRKRD